VSRDEAVPGLVPVLVSFAIILRRFHRDLVSTASCSGGTDCGGQASDGLLCGQLVSLSLSLSCHRSSSFATSSTLISTASVNAGRTVQNVGSRRERWHLLAALCNGSSPVANLQQQSAATTAQPGGDGCDYSRLARRKRRSMRPTPPLCKQGVRGSSPLGSTYFPLSDDISWLIGAGKIYKYSNKYSHGATGVAVSTASRTRGGLTGCAGSMSGLELL
jgi:hypothetical protein